MFTKKKEGSCMKRKYREVWCFLFSGGKITDLPVHQRSGARAPHGKKKRVKKKSKSIH